MKIVRDLPVNISDAVNNFENPLPGNANIVSAGGAYQTLQAVADAIDAKPANEKYTVLQDEGVDSVLTVNMRSKIVTLSGAVNFNASVQNTPDIWIRLSTGAFIQCTYTDNQHLEMLHVWKLTGSWETETDTLTAQANPTDTSIDVVNGGLFSPGQQVMMNYNGPGLAFACNLVEFREIDSIATNTLNFTGGLTNTHPVGTKVRLMTEEITTFEIVTPIYDTVYLLDQFYNETVTVPLFTKFIAPNGAWWYRNEGENINLNAPIGYAEYNNITLTSRDASAVGGSRTHLFCDPVAHDYSNITFNDCDLIGWYPCQDGIYGEGGVNAKALGKIAANRCQFINRWDTFYEQNALIHSVQNSSFKHKWDQSGGASLQEGGAGISLVAGLEIHFDNNYVDIDVVVTGQARGVHLQIPFAGYAEFTGSIDNNLMSAVASIAHAQIDIQGIFINQGFSGTTVLDGIDIINNKININDNGYAIRTQASIDFAIDQGYIVDASNTDFDGDPLTNLINCSY